MEQLKRWFSSPRGLAITAIVVVVIALLVVRGKGDDTAQAAGPGAGKAGAGISPATRCCAWSPTG